MFVSEPIEPQRGAFEALPMTAGLAALPAAFTWRGRRYDVVECLDHAKVSAPEGGAGERYLRRETFTVRLHTGQVATLYVLRHAPRGASAAAARRRWFLYAIEP